MSEAEKAVRVTSLCGNVDYVKLSFGVDRYTVIGQLRSMLLGVKSVRQRVMLSSSSCPISAENEE